MSETAKEFVDLYNGIDSLLRSKLSLQTTVDFSSVVNQAKQTGVILSKQADYLLLVGRLRNAIIHDNRYKYPTDPIAEPNPDTITHLRAIKEYVEKPPSIDVLPKHQPKIFMSSDRLLVCLQHMRENDFSQVVVLDDHKYSLITREDIARWFEKQIVDNDIVISLENVKIEEILGV